jgi:hypothetical protein
MPSRREIRPDDVADEVVAGFGLRRFVDRHSALSVAMLLAGPPLSAKYVLMRQG